MTQTHSSDDTAPAYSTPPSELVDFALDQVGDAVFLIDVQARIRYVNGGACRALGYNRAELLQMGIADIDPNFTVLDWPSLWAGTTPTHSQKIESLHRHRDGREFPVEITGIFFEFEGCQYNLTLARDITEHKRRARHEQMRTAVLEQIVRGAPLPEILHTIAVGVEAGRGDMLCSILLLDSEGKRLMHGAAPSLPDFYNDAVHGVEIDATAGTCAAAFSGRRVIVEDISTHPNWVPFREPAARAGVAACWSEPIRDKNGRVLGTLALYHRTAHAPTAGDIELIETTAALAGVAIEYRQVEAALQMFRYSIDNASDAIYWLNSEGGFSYVNDEACRSLGYSREELLQMHLWDIDPVYPKEQFLDDWAKGQGQSFFQVVNMESVHRRKDGSLFPIEVAGQHAKLDGDLELHIAYVRDVSARKTAERRLQLTQHSIEKTKVAIFWNDANGEFTYVNDHACESLGYTREELLGKHPWDINPDFSVAEWPVLRQEMREKSTVQLESRHRRKDGVIFPVSVTANLVLFDGEEYGFAFAQDISEREQAELALRESEERFRQLAEYIQEVFWLIDTEHNRALYVSPAYETIWGRSCASLEAMPSSWLHGIHPEDRQRVLEAARRRGQGDYEQEYRVVRPDGEIRHVHEQAFAIRDRSGAIYRVAGIARDITARKEQEARIQHLAYHCALTGLPNRLLVLNRIEQAIVQAHRRSETLAVMFLDLDRFKAINDTLGHRAGDALLQQVATRLRGLLREEDTIGRVGGDEFLMLLPNLDSPEDAAHVARKVLEALAVPFHSVEHDWHIAGSIGISICPRDGEDAETLIKYADTALYLAKEQGRNTFRFFSPELDARVHARLLMENDLRRAIERGQFRLHYQPQIDLASGGITGVEALLRWQHPERGMVPPADFVPVAEDTGLIMPMGEWVLRAACTQARIWQHAGRSDLRVAVNLSRRQLEKPNLAATVQRILQETTCDPRMLELEVTESSIMADPATAITALQALNDMGVQLAMDDFGTGYSSLAHLKRFPLDRLKIDRSFVEGIPTDADDTAIVETIIAMARKLRLRVVAEGVETEAQREFLRSNGCDEAQGYLFGKPVPVEQIDELLAASSAPCPTREQASCPQPARIGGTVQR